jgi:hypothetical protein
MKNFFNPINIFLFLLLIIVVASVTSLYILKEQYYYFWDYSTYFQKTNDLVLQLKKSPVEAALTFLFSLFDDYTQLPLIPILPFRLLLGSSRLGFVLSLALAYIIPFCLVMGVIATQIIPSKSHSVFWLTAFISLLIPPVWIPVFRGFPDIGGEILLMLATLFYWKNTNLKNRQQIKNISIFLALSVLFRRHFIYETRVFLATICIYNIIDFIPRLQTDFRNAWFHLQDIFWRVGHIALLFAIFTFIVFIKVLFINYRALYSSYELSSESNFLYYGQAYGWMLWGLALLGFILGCFEQSFFQPNLRFIALFGILSTSQWIFFAKQVSAQYSTHFLPFVILGISLLGWIIWLKRRLSIQTILFGLQSFLLTLNIGIGLDIFGKIKSPAQSIFAKRESPLFREDYHAIIELIGYLRNLSTPKQQFYIASSSYTFNYSIITVAEQQHFGKPIVSIARTTNIDSRDFYPLNSLIQSHYVVVANPFQHHVMPQEQKLVQGVVEMFNKNLAIAQDFTPLPQTFALEHGVKVRIYKRIRPTSFPTILETLAKMRSQVSRIPGQEPYWLDLKSEQPSAIIQDPLLRMVQVLRLQITNKTPATLLYFGKIPAQTKVTGLYSITKCPNTSDPISLQISTLDKNGSILAQATKSYTKSELAPFELKIEGQNAAFIRLSIRVNSTNQSLLSSCRAELNLLKVSQQ